MKTCFPPRRVLAPVDLTEPSLSALETAKSLSARLGARLEALYVEPFETLTTYPEGVSAAAAVAEQRARLDFRKEWRARLSGLLRDQKPAARLVLARGDAPAEILKRTGARGADLIVMGTHGRTGGERFFMGSVAESVIHRSRVPVLALRAEAALGGSPILAPCRLTRYADEALVYALEFARALGIAAVILYVPPREEWELDAELRVRTHLNALFGPELAGAAKIVVRRGDDPREEILAEAQSGRYCALALSAHLRAKLSDLAMGSTAERLLRRCPLPILAVPDLSEAPARPARAPRPGQSIPTGAPESSSRPSPRAP